MDELIAFLAYLAMFYAPLGALSHFTTWLTSFLSGSKRTVSEPRNPTPWSDQKGEIEFDHVTFGYHSHQPILKDISFRVALG